MGFSASWIGVKGRSKEAVLAELDLMDTGRPDPENQAQRSCAELPGGWLIVYANEFDFASPKTIASLSTGALSIGCAIEEHVMFSGLRAYQDGRGQWGVIHDPQDGIYSLRVSGEPPAELAAIRDRAMRLQDEAGGAKAGVDFIFDVPMDLAQALCGFRHDGVGASEPAPVFTELEPEFHDRPKGGAAGKRSWLASLFRRER